MNISSERLSHSTHSFLACELFRDIEIKGSLSTFWRILWLLISSWRSDNILLVGRFRIIENVFHNIWFNITFYFISLIVLFWRLLYYLVLVIGILVVSILVVSILICILNWNILLNFLFNRYLLCRCDVRLRILRSIVICWRDDGVYFYLFLLNFCRNIIIICWLWLNIWQFINRTQCAAWIWGIVWCIIW